MSITSDGQARSFILVRPPGVNGPAPVVILLHGAGAPDLGATMQSELKLDPVAARNGVVTVYPDGDPVHHSWHTGCCHNEAADPVDEHFISDLIDNLVAAGIADPDHVVVGGFSAGAALANDLGCTLADKISAVVSVAGVQLRPPASVHQAIDPPVAPCSPSRPVTRLEIHGVRDRTIPIAGRPDGCSVQPCGPGQYGYFPSAATVDQWWRTIDHCQAPARLTIAAPRVPTQATLASCADGTLVGFAQVPDAGHDVGLLQGGLDIRQTLIDLATGHALSAWRSQ